MKKSPLVSVIIPFFNEEKYLDKCISSLLDQSHKDIEIIVVDDGSTDSSASVARKYRVKYLYQDHQGSGAARNYGVSEAKGEIMVFADADMHFDEEYVDNLIQPILEGKTIGTFVKEELVANADNVWSRCWSFDCGLPYDRRLPADYPESENAFRAILKEYFIKAGGFKTNEGYTDDSSVSKKLKMKAINARDAVCYHFNPSDLREVFFSARWIGRSKLYKLNLINFLRFSPVNSLRVSIKYLLRGAPLMMPLFKLVYDAGILTGIFMSKGKTFK